ncbi:MAG: hypothetical protein HY301_01540 [Verrucomicrobia bacterium]|nr:hypothetical protein [Verrucomicrobiota bacterium]
MKRAAVILLLSTAVGVFVYCGTYYTGTESRRSLLESGEPELAWLRRVTPEIEQAIAAAAKLRGECQRDMLQHFFEVSQTMPAAQGRRYLDWVQRRTFLTVERETSQR